MSEIPIIKAEEVLNELIRQENDYIMNNLYYRCEYCGREIKLKDGVLTTSQDQYKTDVTKDKEFIMEVTRDIKLVCGKCPNFDKGLVYTKPDMYECSCDDKEAKLERCGLCMEGIEHFNDCRAADLKYKDGTYFHNLCWDNMIKYAKYRRWIK